MAQAQLVGRVQRRLDLMRVLGPWGWHRDHKLWRRCIRRCRVCGRVAITAVLPLLLLLAIPLVPPCCCPLRGCLLLLLEEEATLLLLMVCQVVLMGQGLVRQQLQLLACCPCCRWNCCGSTI